MDETKELEVKAAKTFWEVVPRKIVGGLVAMWLIAEAAGELKEAAKWQFALAILCMSGLGFAAIWTHYLLERKPKEKKIDVTENKNLQE